ncbi:uncharacterized protein Bfra_004706 [Botrytis fragariae]|uniref:Uncharacterized protein n=1 Tax=Botrytis fragariae TaxID=1964551 RepID=A0A8H6AVW2_9HELO|nr:uncharacterized protein Bfra_004706 [Botrytis fragariae]KAF5874691.1 hypothetical protein Bfra_004706 [Botrytis fragariae]
MGNHSYLLPIRAKDTRSVVQNALSQENIESRPAADVHSDQKTFDVAGSPEPYSPHAPIESAATSNDDAPQSRLPLRHNNNEQQDSVGDTRIKSDKLEMSANDSTDSQSSPKKKTNGRVLYCDILGPDGTPWLPKLSRKQRQMKKRWYRAAVQAKMAKDEMLAAAEKERIRK